MERVCVSHLQASHSYGRAFPTGLLTSWEEGVEREGKRGRGNKWRKRERAWLDLPCLQVISIVEANMNRGHHPGLEQHLQDLLGHRVSDEMEVKRVLPAKEGNS